MDETDSPQTPPELLVILAALADEKVPAQTIAPKFTGRFNKGVDYVGNVLRVPLLVIHAVIQTKTTELIDSLEMASVKFLNSIVERQSGTVLGFLPAWGIVYQPFAAVLFLTAAIAENKRIPFDLPEAESELISGYFTEYTSMKMGLFLLSEFIEIVVISALVVTLFLGGYHVPFLAPAGFAFPGGGTWAIGPLGVALLQVLTFSLKVFIVGCFQIQVRWTLPRFRYDQVLRFAWKFMFPLALANLTATAIVLWALQ